MNNMKRILYIGLLFLVPMFFSCVEDLGNDTLSEINEIEISGIEESYSVIAKQETLVINPEIKGSLSASDESNLSYEWFLCDNGIMPNHNHTTISTDKNLNYFVESSPSNYTLIFSVTDKSTGLKWEHETSLSIVSPMVRGFYLVGDKSDGAVGVDFLSYISGRDTSVVKDVYANTKGLKGAENALFTGYYYSPEYCNFWIVANNGSYQIEKEAELTTVKEMADMSNPEEFIFPTVSVPKPQQVINIVPTPYGTANTNRARSRLMFTRDHVYGTSLMTPPEAYGNPINCYRASSPDLFKVAPYVFYKDNTTYLSALVLFDRTNYCFVRGNSFSNYGAPTYCIKVSNNGTPFYFDQTKYTPVRDLVYGENGYGNGGRSYALMNNENGEYFVYCFTVNSAASITANVSYQIDMSVATEFAQADFYTFFSMQPIVLYSVGAKLYAYDYARKECKLVNTFDSNITYLAIDFHSSQDPTHLWVATYGGTGKVYGYKVDDNQNAINVTPVEHEVFETDLKVVKMVYRNYAS